MCLGIPGQIVEILDHHDLARAEVSGVRRVINVGLLADEPLAVGDWVLIHVGFAMSRIDEDEAAQAMASLQLLGRGLDDEMEAFLTSRLEAEPHLIRRENTSQRSRSWE